MIRYGRCDGYPFTIGDNSYIAFYYPTPSCWELLKGIDEPIPPARAIPKNRWTVEIRPYINNTEGDILMNVYMEPSGLRCYPTSATYYKFHDISLNRIPDWICAAAIVLKRNGIDIDCQTPSRFNLDFRYWLDKPLCELLKTDIEHFYKSSSLPPLEARMSVVPDAPMAPPKKSFCCIS